MACTSDTSLVLRTALVGQAVYAVVTATDQWIRPCHRAASLYAVLRVGHEPWRNQSVAL